MAPEVESSIDAKLSQSGISDEALGTELKALSSRKKYTGIIAVACLIAAVVFGIMRIWSILIPALLAACVFGMINLNSRSKMSRMVKSNVVRDALGGIFANCTYRPQDWLPSERISKARLIDDWDEISGSDYVSGKYRGHDIELSDIRLVKVKVTIEKDEDGKETKRETRETVFRGQWIVCKLDRPLNAMVRVREKRERTGVSKSLFGERQRAKSDVETENVAFNDQFQILTNDPHSAFYVLTPHFMEYIVAADRQSGGQTSLCFSGDWAYIAIHNNRDSFELKGDKELSDIPALRKRIGNEVKYITDILNELFQNENLFAREEK